MRVGDRFERVVGAWIASGWSARCGASSSSADRRQRRPGRRSIACRPQRCATHERIGQPGPAIGAVAQIEHGVALRVEVDQQHRPAARGGQSCRLGGGGRFEDPTLTSDKRDALRNQVRALQRLGHCPTETLPSECVQEGYGKVLMTPRAIVPLWCNSLDRRIPPDFRELGRSRPILPPRSRTL
jgi:hypothetical protein